MSWHKNDKNNAVWYLAFWLNKIINKRVSLTSIFLQCFVMKHWEMLPVLLVTTLISPMYLGKSFRAGPLGKVRFLVDRYTNSPTSSVGGSFLFLLAWCVCITRLSMMASRAIARLSHTWRTNPWMPGAIFGALPCSSCAIRGIYPYMSSKGANPVDPLTLELIANSTMGTFSIQSFWSGEIMLRRICVIVLIKHSDTLSVWGWNAVDIRSFTLRSRCICKGEASSRVQE